MSPLDQRQKDRKIAELGRRIAAFEEMAKNHLAEEEEILEKARRAAQGHRERAALAYANASILEQEKKDLEKTE